MKINEITDNPKADDAEIDALVKTIRTECSQFIPYVVEARYALYRGLQVGTKWHSFVTKQRQIPLAFVGKSISRYGSGVSPTEKEFDNLLLNAGFTALRSNSIYTTGDQHVAEGYGEMYEILPKNGFTYTWAPGAGKDNLYVVETIGAILKSGNTDPENVRKYLSDTNLAQAIKQGTEIYIHGEYYAFSRWKMRRVLDKLWNEEFHPGRVIQ